MDTGVEIVDASSSHYEQFRCLLSVWIDVINRDSTVTEGAEPLSSQLPTHNDGEDIHKVGKSAMLQ